MTNTAFSYVRFSTKGQITGDSLSRQLGKARAYAKRHKLVLDESSYRDLGISAFRGKNATEGALKAFLDAVDDGTIPKKTTLLIESLDRLSRANIMDALPLFMSIINRGVTVVTLVDENVYTRERVIKDNGMTLFASMMVLIRAHEESATKSMRSKAGIQAAKNKGIKHAKCPFWLKASADRLSYKVLEDKADIVREVFKLKVEGGGIHSIAIHLNQTYGFKYGGSQVARLLHNPAVIGTRISQAGHEPITDYYPAIVAKDLFYDVQRLMSASIGTKRGRRAEDEPNLFSGLARCSKCGGAMRFFRESPYVSQRYLKCVAAVTNAGCEGGYVNYDALEKEVIGTLLLDQDDELIPLLEKKPGPKVVSNAEILDLKAQQGRYVEALGAGLMNPRLIAEKLNALEMQIKDLENAVLEVPPDDRLFAEKAWELVERHEDARLGNDKEALYAVRREIKATFQRAIRDLVVFPEERVGHEINCKFAVTFRAFEGELVREYVRPALIRVKGVWNPRKKPVLA